MVVNNPNNWHWVNKNCLPWAKEYFSEKLPQLEFEDGEVRVASLSVTGDCDVSNRKGKVICIYDMELDISVSGKNNEESFSGTINIKDFIHDETDYEYTFKNFGAHKAYVQQTILPVINKQLWQFQKELIETHEKDLQNNVVN